MSVRANSYSRRWLIATGGCLAVLAAAVVGMMAAPAPGQAAFPRLHFRQRCDCGHGNHISGDGSEFEEEGTWYWLRSPEQEKRVIISEYNRYCIRCHGVD